MFDREGVEEPGDLALVGTEAQVQEMIEDLKEAGVTDFAASEFVTNSEEADATRALLRSFC
jgi:alkanesulfonate monooxygenase SsuD/methylene tetrahydromethanopterin reductase-like flavin-dependent oxidoreductase (luciferase family)